MNTWGLTVIGNLHHRTYRHPLQPWSAIAAGLPLKGDPGINHHRDGDHDVLVYRDPDGVARGALYRTPDNRLGVYRDPAWAGRGIGRRLAHQAGLRWGIDLRRQHYTAEGWRMTTHALGRERPTKTADA